MITTTHSPLLKAWRRLSASATAVALCLALCFGALACGKPDKPKELLEIEALWQDPATRQIKNIPGAELYYRESRQFRYDAQEAYEDNEIELAREYAIWSRLRYRSAIAVAKQFAATQRLEASNAKVASRNPELTAINQERNKLNTEVTTLERQLTAAKRRQGDNGAIGIGSIGSGAGADEAARLNQAEAQIASVEAARVSAVDVGAGEHAAATFNRAENMLKSLRTLSAQKPVPLQEITTTSKKAVALYAQAAEEARPVHKEELAKQDPAARLEALAAAASSALGAPSALTQGLSVVALAPGSFSKGSATLSGGGLTALQSIATLAKEYDEFSLSIEAFTGRGDATENLGLSQLRARAVKEALIEAGVDSSRITSSKGQGQENLRFPDAPSQNERFEVTFRR